MPRDEVQFQYRLIAQEIKGQILRGEIRSGERLQSERNLGLRFQVQRNTIRQALAVLESEGQIVTSGRSGSYVLPPSPTTGGILQISIHRGSGPNINGLVEGFSQVAERAGFRLGRQSTDPLPDSEISLIPSREELPSDTAGVVLWPHYPSDPDRIKRLNEWVPLVLVDRRIMGVSSDCVRFDDLTGGKLITQHLIDLGHRQIAFLTDEVFAETVHSRWHGYLLAHEEAGIPHNPSLSVLYQMMDARIFAMTMNYLMSDPLLRPTAVVCSNDVVAFALLRYLHTEGIRVPEDMAVTGYGNSMPDYAEAISLTTIDQPFIDLGREAARLLCERTQQTSSERLKSPRDIILPVHLVIRGSTSAS